MADESLLDRAPDDQYRVLDDDGHVRDGAVVPDLDAETLLDMYREMRLGRHFDQRAVKLQRQGRMGTFPPLSGQEAAQVGSVHALHDDDWLFPSYREHIATFVRGVDLADTLRYWMGDERGSYRPEGVNVFTPAVPIATQVPHAVGAAWASKLMGEEKAFLCYFGDGATSEGDFHEGANFAGVFETPAVLFCNNNQWAISVPRERQTASETLAQKATAYGFPGVQVDGMDPLATYAITDAALDHARSGGGPVFVEAVQYRFGAHTTADDPNVYRSEEEVQRWRELDPIPRMETFLKSRGILEDGDVEAIQEEIERAVTVAVEAAESSERPDPAEMFEYVYERKDDRLRDQQAAFERLREQYDEEDLQQ